MSAITGAIRGTSRDEIYQELGLKSLKTRRWYIFLSYMFKIMKDEVSNYLTNLVLKCKPNIRTGNSIILTFDCQTDSFKNYLFPSIPNDWFILDLNIKNFNIQKIIVFYSPSSN